MGGNNLPRIKGFIAQVGDNARAHGFRDKALTGSDFVALIHSEVSEILEEFREGHEPTETYYICKANCNEDIFCPIDYDCANCKDGKPEGIPAELADVVIRCFDMADYYGIDLESAIIEKHYYNKSRPYKHGKKF